ncbi:MAG: hypothetical protein ACR2L3_05305 [Actinomycetota bacterium]
MVDQGAKIYKGTVANRSPGSLGKGAPAKSVTSMKDAAHRRLNSMRASAEPGGGPSGGKKMLAPMNGKHAGSMLKGRPGGVISTFVQENYRPKRKF